MIVQDLIEFIAKNRGITDGDSIYEFLNEAVQEIWNSEDFPGTLEEESFKPYEEGVSFVSLPYYVHSIRGVRPCKRMTTDLMAKATAVMDDQYIFSPWRWRHVKKTPLIRDLEEASQLLIKRALPTSTEEVIVTLGGSGDIADSAQESVLFTAADSEKLTTNSYEDLKFLVKNVITDCNFEVYDSAGNLVAVLPNHYLETHNTIIQITDTCQQSVVTTTCVLILYKPYLPPLLRATDKIPEGLEQCIYYKVLEWLDLQTGDKLERAGIMSAKSATLHDKAAFIADRGQSKPFNTRRNAYTLYAGYRL
jgi:hypothetical protein